MTKTASLDKDLQELSCVRRDTLTDTDTSENITYTGEGGGYERVTC